MTAIARDTSRDRRIEDPTNLYLVHPLAHLLLHGAVRSGISANMVSIAGLAVGTGAAVAFANWRMPGMAALGLVLGIAWLVMDGLDGMVARATGTASAIGRVLDGICDHGVFILIYVAMALSIGTLEAWVLAVAAGAAHAVQSSLYEGERARFHRRLRGNYDGGPIAPPSRNAVVASYDRIAGSMDRMAERLDARVRAADDPVALGGRHTDRAVAPMRFMALLSANMRLFAIWAACSVGDPRLFWWIEIGPLTLITIVGLVWLRRAEAMTV